MPGLRRRRRDQRDQADIRAAADSLQHQMADADRRFGAALLQRVAARMRQARPRRDCEIRAASCAASLAPTNVPSRANAAIGVSMPWISRCNRSTSGIARPAGAAATIRMPWLAIGKIKPRAGAGREHAECRAEAAQPLQPDGAGRGKLACELRDLAPMRIRRSERLPRKRCGIPRAEQSGADRIGPRDPRAIDRPQPGRDRRSLHAHASRGSSTPRNWNSVWFIAET